MTYRYDPDADARTNASRSMRDDWLRSALSPSSEQMRARALHGENGRLAQTGPDVIRALVEKSQ